MTSDRGRFLAALCLLTAAKAAIAMRLGWFGDEYFYWQCSRHLDIAFADHPFMTALLVGLCDGRTAFLAIGLAFPFVVRALARRGPTPELADAAALLALITPIMAAVGLLAVPDAPLVLFASLTLLFAHRAIARGAMADWLVTGAFAALALCTHVRGVLIVAGVAGGLLATRTARARLVTPGPWLAALVGACGTLPVLLFNVRLDFAPLHFQAVERHSAHFQWKPLLEHLPMQAGVVTPLLYGAVIAVLVRLVARALRGDAPSGLDASFALAHLGVFFVASPIMDTSHDNVHWTASGYVPLLPHVPALLRDFVAARPTKARRVLASLAPAIGAAAVIGLFSAFLLPISATASLKRNFTGWPLASELVRRHATSEPAGAGARGDVVVADHYILAGALAHDPPLPGADDPYVLDHPRNHDHGRALQYRLWEKDETALHRDRAGRVAWIVIEWNATRSKNRDAWRAHLDELFADLTEVDRVEVTETKGDRSFTLYRGTVR